MKLIYVEDEIAHVELTQRTLEDNLQGRFTLYHADSIRGALSILANDPDIDLVLTDLRLPDGSGLDLLKKVKELQPAPAVVLVTGQGDEQVAVAALKSGAADYLVKEGDYLHRLPAALTNAIAQNQLGREQAALRAAEHRFRVLVEQLPAAVYTDSHDEYSSALYISPQIKDIIGYSAEEWLEDPKFWLKCVHPDDVERLNKELERTFKTLEDFTLDYRFIHRDGRIVWVRDFAKIILDDNGVPKYWQGLLFDITKEVDAQKALQAERDFALQVLNNMGQGLTVIDQNSQLEYVNPAFAGMVGHAVDEILGKQPADFTVASNRTALLEERSRRQRGLKSTYETKLLHKDGHEVPVVVTGVPRQQNGIVSGAISVITDLTTQKQTEEALERQVKELTILHAVAMAEAESRSEGEIIEQVTNITSQIYSEVCGILVLNQSGDILTPHPSYFGANISNWMSGYPITEGVTGRAVREGRAIRLADVSGEPGYIEIASAIKSELCVPIHVNDKIIGVLNVESRRIDAFNDKDERLLNTIAGGLGTAIERMRLFKAQEMQLKREAALLNLMRAASSSLDLKLVLQTILSQLVTLIPSDSGSIQLLDKEHLNLDIVAAIGPEGEQMEKLAQIQLADFPINRAVIVEKHPMRIDDILTDSRFIQLIENSRTRAFLIVPLIVKDQSIGLITLDSYQVGRFTGQDEELAFAIANHAGTALENARLYQDALQASDRRAVLHRISQDIIRFSQDPEKIYSAIHEAAGRLMPCDVFLIVLRDEGKNENISVYSVEGQQRYEPARLPRNAGFSGAVINDGKSIILRNEKEIAERIYVRFGSSRHVQSVVAVPLIISGKVIGMLSAQSYEPYAYGAEEQALLEMLATHAATAIENNRLFESEQQRRQEAETLRQAASIISSTLDQDIVGKEILAALKQIIPYDSGSVFLTEGETLRIVMADGYPHSDQLKNLTFPIQDEFFQNIKTTGQPIIVEDAQLDTRFKHWGESTHVRGWMMLPLVSRGRVIGTITLDSLQPGAFTQEMSDTALAFAHQAAAAIDNARLYYETQRRLFDLEIINRVSTSLRQAQSQDEILPILLDESLLLADTPHGSIWLYDHARQEITQKIAKGADDRLKFKSLKAGDDIIGYVFTTGEKYVASELKSDPLLYIGNRESIPSGLGGLCIPIKSTVGTLGVLMVTIESGRQITEEINLLTILAEITGNAIHRTELFEHSQEQVHRLTTLRDIDSAIASSTDLRVTLNILMDHTLKHLKADAVDILLYHPELQSLTFLGSAGYYNPSPSRPLIRIGEGLAGQVVMKGELEYVQDLQATAEIKRDPLLRREGFVAYVGVPLIVKGQTKGVFEIYLRSAFSPTSDWMQFLQTLAGQAAIAIDNAQLFDNLQRSNQEIIQAYDTTLEGWARALELRDRETEGHTRRVTEMTIKLASYMGLSGEDLTNIYRGVLLHDIGKMGVPDQILRKTGALTESEWDEMRKHPEYAFNLLAPIPYLRPALDIPYCHHEHWDGSGYPRGLKSEQIPIAARVFSIVDIWDALLSDRPYRKAWPREKVVNYLKEISGTILDPKVVTEFLRMIGESQ